MLFTTAAASATITLETFSCQYPRDDYMSIIPRENHFIWLRYLAAFSIVFSHSRQFDTAPSGYSEVIATLPWLFPGVPVLFFISGFLISLSSIHSSTVAEFLIKRILRIYPPLWAAFILSIVLLFSTGMLTVHDLDWFKFILWCAGQVTVFLYTTPIFSAT